jgi:hypothetical protein
MTNFLLHVGSRKYNWEVTLRHKSRGEQLPNCLQNLGCIRIRSSLLIDGIMRAWVIFVLLVLFRSLTDTSSLLVFSVTGTWDFMYATQLDASWSFLKNMSKPPYTVSILRALSTHFCLIKFCYRARSVLLCWLCCLTWMRLDQSCGVNCFLQSLHWVYL